MCVCVCVCVCVARSAGGRTPHDGILTRTVPGAAGAHTTNTTASVCAAAAATSVFAAMVLAAGAGAARPRQRRCGCVCARAPLSLYIYIDVYGQPLSRRDGSMRCCAAPPRMMRHAESATLATTTHAAHDGADVGAAGGWGEGEGSDAYSRPPLAGAQCCHTQSW